MHIIIGLGNPGERYTKTRHNAGFLFVDFLAEQWNTDAFAFDKKCNAELSTHTPQSTATATHGLSRFFLWARNTDTAQKQKKILVKPQTFMNDSGRSIRALMDFYKCTPQDVIVAHDDIDLPCGTFKIATNSRAAGHNGVQSVIDHLGTQAFTRLRIGIRPHDEAQLKKIGTKDFVLQKFSPEELQTLRAQFGAMQKSLFPES